MAHNRAITFFKPTSEDRSVASVKISGFFSAMADRLYTCPWLGDVKSFVMPKSIYSDFFDTQYRPGQGMAGVAISGSHSLIAKNANDHDFFSDNAYDGSMHVHLVAAFNTDDQMAQLDRYGNPITDIAAHGSKFGTSGAGAIHESAAVQISKEVTESVGAYPELLSCSFKFRNKFGLGVLMGGYPSLFDEITLFMVKQKHITLVSKGTSEDVKLYLYEDSNHPRQFFLTLEINQNTICFPDKNRQNEKLSIILASEHYQQIQKHLQTNTFLPDELRYLILNAALKKLELNKAIRQTRVYSASQNGRSVYWDRGFLNFIRYNYHLTNENSSPSVTQKTPNKFYENLEEYESSPLFEFIRTLPQDIAMQLNKTICDRLDEAYQDHVPREYTSWQSLENHRPIQQVDYQEKYTQFMAMTIDEKIALMKQKLTLSFIILSEGITLHNQWHDSKANHVKVEKYNDNKMHLVKYLYREILPAFQELILCLETLQKQTPYSEAQAQEFSKTLKDLIKKYLKQIPKLKKDKTHEAENDYIPFCNELIKQIDLLKVFSKQYQFTTALDEPSFYNAIKLNEARNKFQKLTQLILLPNLKEYQNQLGNLVYELVNLIHKTSLTADEKDYILQSLLNQPYQKEKTVLIAAIEMQDYFLFETVLIAGADARTAKEILNSGTLGMHDSSIFIRIIENLNVTHPHLASITQPIKPVQQEVLLDQSHDQGPNRKCNIL